MLAPGFGERPRRLALEVDDQEVVIGKKNLPQVVVAVVARLERAARRCLAGVDEGKDHALQRDERLGAVVSLQHAQRLFRLGAHAGAPLLDLLRAEGLGLEGRVAASHGEGAMQLRGARGERLDEGDEGAVVLLGALRLHEALEITQRVAPRVPLVGDVLLQQRERRRLAPRRNVFDRARERHAVLEARRLGEIAPHLELGMQPRTKAAIALQE